MATSCNQNAISIKKTFYQLTNKHSTTGNPTIPLSVLLTKKIWEAINVKAGVTVADFFDDALGEEEVDDEVLVDADDN
jgi:hypothetical protein